MNLEARLRELNLALPDPPKPLGVYVSAVEAGGFLFLSGKLPVKEQRRMWIGRVGTELTVGEGREAAKLAALTAWRLPGPRSAHWIVSDVWCSSRFVSPALRILASMRRLPTEHPKFWCRYSRWKGVIRGWPWARRRFQPRCPSN